MKVFLLVFIFIMLIGSCKPYHIYTNKNFVLIHESYDEDTLFLQDYILCGTFFNLRHWFLFRNHPIYYEIDDVLNLFAKNLDSLGNLVFENGTNRPSYYLCSNRMTHTKNQKTLEELKYLFPQRDNKVRVVPHINFIKEISVGKTMSPIGFYDETLNLKQGIFLNIYFIKNTDVYFMNNVRLTSKNHQDLEINDESFPFFDLEKIDELIGEVLKEYFERVNA
jgi:hypothetical protein